MRSMTSVLCGLTASMALAGASSAAVLTATDFTAVVGPELPNPADGSTIFINGPQDVTDQGWFISSSFSAGDNTNMVGGNVRFGPAASIYRDSATQFDASIGQISSDGNVTTGEISFDVEIAGVNFNGGTPEEIGIAIQVLGWTGGAATTGNDVALQFNGQGAGWEVVGSTDTGSIASAGTFSTGTIDLGTGYDAIAVRVIAFDGGTGNFGDTIDLASITAVPEPATVGLAGLGLLMCGARRRRSA
ncbi:MAG: PEP-CTERM sorting domain-containing protein [Planctomycetota bacterium]